MATHRLVIPNWQPCPQNEWDGHHWSVRAKLKKLDRQMVGGYALQAGTPKATGKRRVRLTIILGPRQRGADPDAYQKSLGDALVACGLLVNDSRELVEWVPAQYEREYEPATVIELEDIA